MLEIDHNDKIKDYIYLSNDGLLLYLLKRSNIFDGLVNHILGKEQVEIPEISKIDNVLGIMYGMSTNNFLISVSQLLTFLGDELKEIKKIKAIFSIINKNIIYEEETTLLFRNLSLDAKLALNLLKIS